MKSYKDYPVLESGRINFSKIGGTLEVPYLCEIQTESYKSFIDKGIEEAFRDIFPIKSNNETMSLEYISSRLDNAKHSFLECKDKDLTYSAPLYATLGLVDSNNGGQMITSEVFMGDIPLMTDSGTFIINGAERVIVSQIVRSPGAYLSKTLDIKTGRYIYNADLIPGRGTWLEFELDHKKDIMYVNAISKKNAIEKVSDVILNSSLYEVNTKKEFKLKCKRIRNKKSNI